MPSAQFHRLPAAQQERILGASLVAFAEDGYDLASTNRIVRDAGISKGVLFKYFTDKEALFLHVVEVETAAYLEGLPPASGGSFFEWIRLATAYKLRHLKERPLAYRLFTRIYKNRDHAVYARAARLASAMAQRLGWDAPRWEFGPLRPGVSPGQVNNLVQWVAAGLQERFAESMPDTPDEEFDVAYAAIVSELATYLEILKSGIYGEGAVR